MKSTPLYYPPDDPNAGVLHGYSVQCPGCGREHVFGVDGEGVIDNDKPTFARELVSCTNDTSTGEKTLCQFVVKNGKVKFAPACSHDKAGTETDAVKVAKKVSAS